ncbi:hypothetical protein HYPDE_24258 [Hyphomicrobium denitrificans 1NES1]|uniref:Uncharacterized protein n=1 Tax=Hyphomicrobium denitrificans 1NES1 TaxID=670307 RepID=N0B2Z2_9HYPH|nr:hypothetical protein [Hyphomicrobium denitrificans]AGK56537.1 hypothetical protein HYPDE_24258 [Hyphomicrobium denitrificans 1NES1]
MRDYHFPLSGRRVLVDIFLLRVMHSDKSFDRFNNSLRIANEIPIDTFSDHVIGQPGQKSRPDAKFSDAPGSWLQEQDCYRASD